MKNEIIIFCDGGSRGNGNKDAIGGYGIVLKFGEHEKEIYGGKKGITNNQAELTGAIESLKALKTTHIPVIINCDSAYVIMGMTQWTKTWIKKNWRKSDGKIVENKELWQELVELANKQENLTWMKVKGHSDNEGNNRADELANKAMDEISKED